MCGSRIAPQSLQSTVLHALVMLLQLLGTDIYHSEFRVSVFTGDYPARAAYQVVTLPMVRSSLSSEKVQQDVPRLVRHGNVILSRQSAYGHGKL